MRLVPFLRVTLVSDLPPDDVVRRLVGMVSRQAPAWFERAVEPFEGVVREREFKIVRNLGTRFGLPVRSTWQPVVVGHVVAEGAGSSVQVRMRLAHALVPIAAVAFVALLSMMTDAGRHALHDLAADSHASPAPVVFAIGLGMAFFTYVFMSVAFWSEVAKARQLLCDGLVCREVRPNAKG